MLILGNADVLSRRLIQSKTKDINKELFYEAKVPNLDGYNEM